MDDSGDLLEAMKAFGAAFRARQMGQARADQDLMEEARATLGSAGVSLVLALLKAGRIPYPDAPWWPVFLSELVRHDPDWIRQYSGWLTQLHTSEYPRRSTCAPTAIILTGRWWWPACPG